jgi:hypothetical protein
VVNLINIRGHAQKAELFQDVGSLADLMRSRFAVVKWVCTFAVSRGILGLGFLAVGLDELKS